MKYAHKYLFTLMALAAGSLVAIGCNQSSKNESSAKATNANVNEASVVAKTEGGCCGKCATEKRSDVQAESCCGKCNNDSGASSATFTEKTDSGCEGDSANCKCSDATATKPAEAGSGTETEIVESHVNTMPEDRDIFHFLLENHEKISRTVTELDNGVTTVTESTDAAITTKIQEHVASMYKRVEDGRPLRMWDELYREIFKHADKIKMELKNTKNGISVTETSDDEYVVKLIKAHAKVVTGFADKGFAEARENHKPPAK